MKSQLTQPNTASVTINPVRIVRMGAASSHFAPRRIVTTSCAVHPISTAAATEISAIFSDRR